MKQQNHRTVSSVSVVVAACGLAMTSAVCAQQSSPMNQTTLTDTQSEERVVDPRRENLAKLQRKVTIELEDTRLEDVIEFIQTYTGADIEPLWSDDLAEGLDKDDEVTISVKDMSSLTFLEEVLDKVQTGFSENQWQMTRWGSVEIGPKRLLNRRKEVVMYDINDLIMEIPDWPEAPALDLESVLQQGEGGGDNPFDEADDIEVERKTKEELAQEIVDLVTSLVESEEWIDNGGDGGSIRHFRGTLLVNAPDYIHRQLNGYAYWPTPNRQRVSQGGRRYVTLGIDSSIADVDGIESFEVPGIAGGEGGAGGGGG